MKKLLKKHKKAVIGTALLVILGALGYWTYLSYQNSNIVRDSNDTKTEPADSVVSDTPDTIKIENTTTQSTDLSSFKITNIGRGSTLTGVGPIKVFVPTGGYALSVTINSDKWGEIFSTREDNVVGEMPITYSFNQAVAPGQSGNVRAILLKDELEVARNEIWINF